MGSVDEVETFGLVDGPGIRTVIFFSGCQLRCKYCHNPEMWKQKEKNVTVEELVKKVLRNKPYFKRNQGGVTLSGGEPLLQADFLIKLCQRLKKENIHIALDTAGVGIGRYEEILSFVDLVLFDVKYADEKGYVELTGKSIEESEKFIDALNKSKKPVWIRQVIVPGYMNHEDYLIKLKRYLQKFEHVEKIEFLPFHHLGFSKYEKLNIENPLKNTKEMSKEECEELYQKFLKISI